MSFVRYCSLPSPTKVFLLSAKKYFTNWSILQRDFTKIAKTSMLYILKTHRTVKSWDLSETVKPCHTPNLPKMGQLQRVFYLTLGCLTLTGNARGLAPALFTDTGASTDQFQECHLPSTLRCWNVEVNFTLVRSGARVITFPDGHVLFKDIPVDVSSQADGIAYSVRHSLLIMCKAPSISLGWEETINAVPFSLKHSQSLWFFRFANIPQYSRLCWKLASLGKKIYHVNREEILRVWGKKACPLRERGDIHR